MWIKPAFYQCTPVPVPPLSVFYISPLSTLLHPPTPPHPPAVQADPNPQCNKACSNHNSLAYFSSALHLWWINQMERRAEGMEWVKEGGKQKWRERKKRKRSQKLAKGEKLLFCQRNYLKKNSDRKKRRSGWKKRMGKMRGGGVIVGSDGVHDYIMVDF